MKYILGIIAALTAAASIAENQNSDVFGLLSPNRIDSVQFGHDRNWDFLDAEELPPTEGCGIRFIEGELRVAGNTSVSQLLEPMGEFCEVLSPVELYGSYAVILKKIGGYMWLSKASSVYSWTNDEVILVYEPWLNSVSVEVGDQVPCSDVALGPFGEKNSDDERTCIRYRSSSSFPGDQFE